MRRGEDPAAWGCAARSEGTGGEDFPSRDLPRSRLKEESFLIQKRLDLFIFERFLNI